MKEIIVYNFDLTLNEKDLQNSLKNFLTKIKENPNGAYSLKFYYKYNRLLSSFVFDSEGLIMFDEHLLGQ